jgi:hypothetical protein
MEPFLVVENGVVQAVRRTLRGTNIQYRVEVSADNPRHIARITRQDERFGGHAVAEFSDYGPDGLPRYVSVTSETAAATIRAQFVIQTLESAAGVDDSMFRVDSSHFDLDSIATIWDDATQTFLKMRGHKRPVAMADINKSCIVPKSER